MLSEVKKVSIAGDMVAGLRHIADLIEAGERPDARFVVTIIVGGEFDVWSNGTCSDLEVLGALTKAIGYIQ